MDSEREVERKIDRRTKTERWWLEVNIEMKWSHIKRGIEKETEVEKDRKRETERGGEKERGRDRDYIDTKMH